MEWHVNKGFWSQDWPNWFLFTSCNYLKHMSLTFLKVTGLWFPPPPHTHTRPSKRLWEEGSCRSAWWSFHSLIYKNFTSSCEWAWTPMEGWKCTMSSAKQILPGSVSTALQALGGGRDGEPEARNYSEKHSWNYSSSKLLIKSCPEKDTQKRGGHDS